MCAPGILALLEPVRERGGLVLEFVAAAACSRARSSPPDTA
jgi:hypothetical protein